MEFLQRLVAIFRDGLKLNKKTSLFSADFGGFCRLYSIST